MESGYSDGDVDDDYLGDSDDQLDEDYGDGDYKDEDGDDGDDYGGQAVEETEALAMEKMYVVLTEYDVCARQEEDIAKVCEVLSVTPGAAAVLLRRYKWSAVQLQEEWFLDERRIREAVGLPTDGGAVPTRFTCDICFDRFGAGLMRSAGCSHFYCVVCWRGYVRAAVGDGARCLSLRCPDPSCSVAVVRELVDTVADDEDRERYAWFALRSYVEESTRIKWCPGPGCSRAVEFVGSGGGDDNQSSEVFCSCGHGFCWRCGEEAHRPVSCKTVAMWVEKNNSESETATWLLVHTKHCPKCRRPIEKNLGCMHMTCHAPCDHEFCWICLEPWRGHVNCERYRPGDVAAAESLNAEDEGRRQAKASLDRYLYHYERWDANLKSLRMSLRDMENLERSEMEKMASAARVPATDMRFMREAYEQVGEGRRVLGWAHAYGYYLDPERDFTKRQLFEYLQEDANASLERLHDCAERERRELFGGGGGGGGGAVDFDTYMAYREKLAGLTRVTRNYFRNLVKAFAGNLPEVSS